MNRTQTLCGWALAALLTLTLTPFASAGTEVLKLPVRVATTANITLSGTQTIDGVAVVRENSVLVKNQTTASQNGIYTVKLGNWARRLDAGSSPDVPSGMTVWVQVGTTQSKRFYVLETTGPIILATTSLSFVEFGTTGSTSGFSFLTSGTNSSAAMIIGTGASLTVSGSGTINATTLNAATFAAAGAIGATSVSASGRVTAASDILLNSAQGITLKDSSIMYNGKNAVMSGYNGVASEGFIGTIYCLSNTGTTASDTCAERSAANTWKFTNGSTGTGNLTAATITGTSAVLTPAGSGVKVKEGVNACMGTLTLNGATPVTTATTCALTASRILLTSNAPNGGMQAGNQWVSSRSDGVSFSVTGIALDTSTVAWFIINPAP